MNKPKAYGSFVKRGENVFRTSAFIQWGDSEASIGACLLLNPGSATLDNELTYELDTKGSASGWVKTEDPTMQQLISVVEGVYEKDKPITGRFHIYNLFNLQNTIAVNAVDQFESLVQSGEYEITESLPNINELKTHPWILLGWGVRRESKWKNLELIKNQWRELIEQAEIPNFGKKHKSRNDYYHPCPLIPTGRLIIVDELIVMYKQKYDKQLFPIHAIKPNLIVNSKQVEAFDDHTDGWHRTSANPESVVMGFSHLHIKEGYKLRAYQYFEGGNGNGIVWAIPLDEKLPEPSECTTLEWHFLDAPKPLNALSDFMKAINGDKTPLSYLQASIVFHELHEFGAVWHGISWGRDRILSHSDDIEIKYKWEMIEENPDIIEPHFFYNQSGYPVIVFYTINDIGSVTFNKYVHTFNKNDYTVEVERSCIATAGIGIIF
ncbi:hypothetical protein MPH47_09805 [Psychrobacillus psychrodurans]|uniref:hypothetical protein n=1 Tax=Psychrobacillus psychrodurans TaxID=126157 RepID=UPI001F4E25D1|nr:hypothetical protein [Psychrobacillus psychrodurans]MCK1997511.1 hypothetical protein [Psychrobacillus psychrodurans]